MECQSDDQLQSLLGSNVDLLLQSGYTKPLTRVTLKDKPNVVQTLSLHEVLLKSLGEAHQFRDGMNTLGVTAVLSKHGDYVRRFYCNDSSLVQPLTAGMSVFHFSFMVVMYQVISLIDALRKIFGEIVFSEKGCNERQKEESAYFMFLNYLDKCEKGQ